MNESLCFYEKAKKTEPGYNFLIKVIGRRSAFKACILREKNLKHKNITLTKNNHFFHENLQNIHTLFFSRGLVDFSVNTHSEQQKKTV
jgi:hypothetical protein